MNNTELEKRMDRIIDWVKTCDTKASIMLTLVGLMTSFVFTSDYVLNGIESVFISFFNYDFKNSSLQDISISGVLSVVFLLFCIYTLFGSIYRFVMVLYSFTKEDLTDSKDNSLIFKFLSFLFFYSWHKEELNTYNNSLIHFNHIADLTVEEFKAELGSYGTKENDDYISQVYINAKRCKQKFHDYNSAIKWMLCAIPFIVAFFISLLLFCSNNQLISKL